MKQHIAVLLTVYNRKQKTMECLTELYNAVLPKGFELECFLVDDGSTDGTKEEIEKHFPAVNIIKGTGKLFWNKGMHLAWKSAISKGNYDFYLWLNNDTFLFKDAITELLTCHTLANENAIICGATCDATESNFTYGGKNINGEPLMPNGTIQNCEVINGNVVLVSNKICKHIGILDPMFPHAIGDHDYGLRAIKNGHKIYTSRRYIAICDANHSLPDWCKPSVSLNKRIKSLYSPKGSSHPYYFFIYEYRYFGLLTALKHFCSIQLRVFFPKLWQK